MAQTITLQRGRTSISGNGTTGTTVFTLPSTGVATRVIFGNCSVKNTQNVTISACVFSLAINVNGTGNYIPVAIQSVAQDTKGMSVTPGVTGINPTNSTFATTGVVIGSQGTNIEPYTDLTSVRLYGTQANTTGITGVNFKDVPEQFWMGPNDSLVAFWYNNGTYTGNFDYSFTLITET